MARGIAAAGDVVQRLADGTDTNALFNEATRAAEIINGQRSGLLDMLTFKTTSAGDHVLQADSGFEFEQMSEYGQPVGHRVAPVGPLMGYAFGWFDTAGRATWKFLLEASAEQVRAQTNGVLTADNKLCFDHVMGSLLDPSARVSPEGNPVYGLYSGDGSVPPTVDDVAFDGAHTHYLTTGSTALDGEDVAVLVNHVRHHGYAAPGSASKMLVIAHPDTVERMRTFRVESGDPADFIPSVSAPAYLSKDTIAGRATVARSGPWGWGA